MKRFLSVILTVAALPAFAAFGPERPVTTAPLGPAYSLQVNPSVTVGSEAFLVIWTDHRSGSGDAFATRVDSRGNVLDPTGIVLGRNAVASSAAAPGRDYLVALTEGCRAVQVVTLDSVTAAVGSPRQIGDLGGVCAPVLLVANGKTVLAVMGDRGTLLDPTGVPVVESVSLPANSVAGATNGRDYVVVSMPGVAAQRHDIVVTEVAGRGEAISARTLDGNAEVTGVAISANGDGYVVIWTTETAVQAVAIPDNFSSPAPVRVLATGQKFSAPRIVWTGNEHRVAYLDGGAGGIIKMMSVDSQARAIEGPVDASAGGERQTPSFAAIPHFISIGVWSAPGEGIIAGFFEAGRSLTAGIYLRTKNLTSSATTQGPVGAVSTGASVVVAWLEGDSTGIVLRARRTDGRATGADIVNVATIRVSGAQLRPDVRFDGNTVWISWLEGRTLYTRRYSSDLSPRDAGPVRVSDRVQEFDSAAGSNRAIFVWTADAVVAATVMTANDPGALSIVLVAQEQYTAGDPAAAWNGSSFSLAWARVVSPASQGLFDDLREIRTARVSTSGALLDPTPVVLSARFGANAPTVWMASSTSGVLTAWQASEGSSISIRGDGPEILLPATHAAMRIESLTSAGSSHVLGFSTAASPGQVQYWIHNVHAGGASTPELVTAAALFAPSRSMALVPVDQRLVAIYVRRADSAEYGSVNRLFMRGSDPPARRRAVAR